MKSSDRAVLKIVGRGARARSRQRKPHRRCKRRRSRRRRQINSVLARRGQKDWIDEDIDTKAVLIKDHAKKVRGKLAALARIRLGASASDVGWKVARQCTPQ